MASRAWQLLGACACLALGACKTQVSGNLNGVTTGGTDALSVKGSVTPSSAPTYAWNYPQYPQGYAVDPLSRDFANGRQIGENGSFAGPWLEGEATKQLPVGQPNIMTGQAITALLEHNGGIPAAARPTLADSPYQAYLKLTGAVGARAVNGVPITRDQLWDVTFWLYRNLEPNIAKAIPVRFDPASKTDPSKQKNGSQLFLSNCAMCHGSDGWGRGKSGQALQPPPANFHEPRRLYNRSDQRLYLVLRQGVFGSAMPPWQDKLSDAEIKTIIAYVRSFSYGTEVTAPPSQAAGGGANLPALKTQTPSTAAPAGSDIGTPAGAPSGSASGTPAGSASGTPKGQK